jgi:hypothetical protein
MLLTVVFAATLALPDARAAGEPTMPLSAVQSGMVCTAKTVIRGTDISTFEVKVVDVVGGGSDARILARASGPAVDSTGVAQGFSGSPVYCPAPGGGSAIAGAVSAGTGDYGNLLILVTPIETMLNEPISSPLAAKVTRATLGALTVTGTSGPVADALRAVSRRSGRKLIVAPGVSKSLALTPSALVPGSSVAASYSTGAISVGAVGTVTYVDGNRIWAFGHPFDGVGRRDLLLQDAFVHTVVGNPLSVEGANPYKFASTIGAIGTLTDDRPAGVSGVLGALPRTIPLTVRVRNTETGKLTVEKTELTDETTLGSPAGGSTLEGVGAIAVAQAAYDALRSSPTQMRARLCLKVTIAERKKPLAYCNRYVGGSATSPGGAMPDQVAAALSMVAGYRFAALKVKDVDVKIDMAAAPGVAYIRKLTVSPNRVRPGQRVTVRVEARVAGTGEKIIRSRRIRVPQFVSAGRLPVKVAGQDVDIEATSPLDEVLNILLDDEADPSSSPRSVEGLAKEIKRFANDDRAVLRVGGTRLRVPLLSTRDYRLSGSASGSVRVRQR